MSDTERALVDEIDKRKRLAKRLEEYEQPDDALLRIGAPALPFLEQVEWMRKRLEKCEATLKRYADPKNWGRFRQDGPLDAWDCDDEDAWNGPDLARAALEE